MKILGIESSCDETAAAVVENGRTVLSNAVATQIEEHKLYGGVVPEIASRRHAEAICPVVEKALRDSGCGFDDIDAIAVTYAPGLIGALLVGVNYAKGLSFTTGKPLIPVHHLRSHIASNYISHPELEPPFFCLVVSGGHTHMIEVSSYTDFRIIGRTHDDAAGEALDKAARAMGLPYPGGLNLDKTAQNGDSSKYKFPHPSVDGCPYDFSFSGLKTSVINTIHNAKQKGGEVDIENLGASFMSAVVDCLVKNVEKACADFGYDKVVLAGGVSANSVLRKRMKESCDRYSRKLFVPELKYCGDNAAMVGSQGYYEALSGNFAGLDLNAAATLPIDFKR
ncbi:MAG: tRNA (adenosine(37)-N6)-threonylcarbamoyltransferase complex transferase subunit TsaD [Oscillospiraceae bacterium]|nr:tRNA (adenosine(37)-N6)-threonylcarbamoyltransferase complex transferase subunit TsaD [Oscillospiraceae bacterium]